MITLPQSAHTIISSLQKAGFQAYVVGGSVRDLLMNRPTKGFDFTTNAKPEEIVLLFPDSFYDNQFGTVGIKVRSSGISTKEAVIEPAQEDDVLDIYEVTTYRNEKGYTDLRHPDTIQWGSSVEEDLSRRDFTINAIATDGVTLIDPYHGRDDIEKKCIRTVGAPIDRFSEDALRMMRAIRIASQLGFVIDPDTALAITKTAHLLQKISGERIRDELFKILASPFPSEGITLLKNTGILEVILPELFAAFSVDQKSPERHHLYDVGTHSLLAMKLCPSTDPIVRLATLLHDIGKPATVRKTDRGVITFYNHEVVGTRIARTICSRLRLSKKQTDKILTLIRWHQFTVDERQTDSALRRFIRRVTVEYLPDMLALRIGDRLGGGALETSWRLELFKKRLEEVQQQPFSVSDLHINGHVIMNKLECPPGPRIGKLLNQLFAEVEEGTLANTEEALLARLSEIAALTE